MASIIEQVTPVLAGGGIGLISLWVGRRWEHRAGQDAWLKEQRMRAYTEMLQASFDVWQACERFELVRQRTGYSRDDYKTFAAACHGLFHQHEQIVLVGPNDTSARSAKLASTVYDLMTWAYSYRTRAPEEETGAFAELEVVTTYRAAHDQFVLRAQAVIQAG